MPLNPRTVNAVTDPSPVEGVRQRNLARLLRLVHVHGPQSRANLTEATGLNRSTVADLLDAHGGAVGWQQPPAKEARP